MTMKDTLSAASITLGLKTQFIGQRVIYYPSLASTMDIARQEAQQGATEGTVIIADAQTAAKGRLKRAWVSPKGNVALSIILYPDITQLPSIVMLTSLAVTHSIATTTGLKPQLKWPNDVLLNGRKVCGILIESDLRGNKANYIVIGIGINVNLRLADFPELLPIATSLSDELGEDVSRLNLVRHLLAEMETMYLALRKGTSVYEEWRDSLVTLGRKVRVKSNESTYEGIADSVGRDGSLLVRGSDGSLTRVFAGDVTLHD